MAVSRNNLQSSMVGNHQNTVPQTNVVPSTHAKLSIKSEQNSITEEQIVFTLSDTSRINANESAYTKHYKSEEETLVTLPKLNLLLRQACNEWTESNPGFDTNGQWFATPNEVMKWASPLGVAGAPFYQPGSHNRDEKKFVPVRLARKVSTKHAFQSAAAGKLEWVAKSSHIAALQYSVETYKPTVDHAGVNIVFVSCVMLDKPSALMYAKGHHNDRPPFVRDKPLVMQAKDNTVVFETPQDFQKPMKAGSVYVHLGRVQLTSAASPNCSSSLQACINQAANNSMHRITLMLGVH